MSNALSILNKKHAKQLRQCRTALERTRDRLRTIRATGLKPQVDEQVEELVDSLTITLEVTTPITTRKAG